MNAQTPKDYELYRVVTDYEALQDGFLDRIEDLETTFEQIEMAGELPKGYAAKLLMKSQKRVVKALGPHSLGKMLKGTGLVLALVADDERFAPIRAQLTKRRRKPTAAASIKPSKREMADLSAQLVKEHMRKIGAKGNENGAASSGGKRRAKMMGKRARQRSATHAARMRWSKRRA